MYTVSVFACLPGFGVCMPCLIVTVACDSGGSSVGNCFLKVYCSFLLSFFPTSFRSTCVRVCARVCVYVRVCVCVCATLHARFGDTVVACVLVTLGSSCSADTTL